MNRSDTIGAIAAALAAAQKAFAPIPKDREVTVRTKTGSYKFKYATLDAIRSATMPALAEQGLAIVQATVPRLDPANGWAVQTMLMHSSGEWIANMTPMVVETREGERAGNQQLGSAQTYARRYGWTSLLCVTADEDDDGNNADGNHVERAEDRPHKPGPAGSAAAGADFRPPGPRQMPVSYIPAKTAIAGGDFRGVDIKTTHSSGPTSDWVGDAKRDGIVDANRTKGNIKADILPDSASRARWCKTMIEGIQTIQVKADLVDWWKANKGILAEIEAKMPAEYERLLAAFDQRMDTVAAKGI